MNLNHLRWVLEVERTGSFTAAANNLYIAQSNLSNAVKAMEEELGFQIFYRTPKGTRATPMGRDFLEYARTGVYHLEGLSTVYGRRIISIAQHRHCTFVSDAVTASLHDSPDACYRYYIRECSEQDVLDSVFSGESMFGVMFYLSETEEAFRRMLLARNLTQKVFCECGVNILVRDGHPLLSIEHPSAADLYAYTPIAFTENETRDSTYASQAADMGLDSFDRFPGGVLVSDRATLYSILSQSDCIFITGLISRRDMEIYGLKAVSFPSPVRKYSIVTPNGMTMPPLCKDLIDRITDAAKKLL